MKKDLISILVILFGILFHNTEPVVVTKFDLKFVLQSGLNFRVGLIILLDLDILSIFKDVFKCGGNTFAFKSHISLPKCRQHVASKSSNYQVYQKVVLHVRRMG